jgi:hypothetical protein
MPLQPPSSRPPAGSRPAQSTAACIRARGNDSIRTQAQHARHGRRSSPARRRTAPHCDRQRRPLGVCATPLASTLRPAGRFRSCPYHPGERRTKRGKAGPRAEDRTPDRACAPPATVRPDQEHPGANQRTRQAEPLVLPELTRCSLGAVADWCAGQVLARPPRPDATQVPGWTAKSVVFVGDWVGTRKPGRCRAAAPSAPWGSRARIGS